MSIITSKMLYQLLVGSTDAYNHIYYESLWCQLSKFGQKYKEKDNDKDKYTDGITETLLVCYIFGILMTQTFQVWRWIPHVTNVTGPETLRPWDLETLRPWKLETLRLWDPETLRLRDLVTLWPRDLEICDLDTLWLWDLETLRPWELDTLRPWDIETLRPWNLETLRHWDLETLRPRGVKWYVCRALMCQGVGL